MDFVSRKTKEFNVIAVSLKISYVLLYWQCNYREMLFATNLGSKPYFYYNRSWG